VLILTVTAVLAAHRFRHTFPHFPKLSTHLRATRMRRRGNGEDEDAATEDRRGRTLLTEVELKSEAATASIGAHTLDRRSTQVMRGQPQQPTSTMPRGRTNVYVDCSPLR